MMFSENRYPPRTKCGAGFFGIMLCPFADCNGEAAPKVPGADACVLRAADAGTTALSPAPSRNPAPPSAALNLIR